MILLAEVREDDGVTAGVIRRRLLAGPRSDVRLQGFRTTITGEATRRTPAGPARPAAGTDELPAVMTGAGEG